MTDHDPPVDAVVAKQVADALRGSSDSVRGMVDDQVQEFDEVLSTVLLDEVGELFRTSVHAGTNDAPAASRAAAVLGELYVTGGESMHTVIATGFLEAMPHCHDEDRDVVGRLPPALREELHHSRPPATRSNLSRGPR